MPYGASIATEAAQIDTSGWFAPFVMSSDLADELRARLPFHCVGDVRPAGGAGFRRADSVAFRLLLRA
mgnify:CR=1 FL=1